ncbi:flagellar biosynthesis regulator FlaF [Kordiimonas lipolytica]|uniref:Flagellar biosynthesis regulator FlaF n=1 Tax=Kordiimonas lipolytica TaxID=1662421 RepID=A0ABV8UFP1_9PROT|nr:flagellar biosynthesis regulator FlaF [Kordiimonas lipolytica]
MSYQAYQKAQHSAENPSQVEYRLFAEVTNALIKAKDRNIRDKEMVEALDWNRRMWSVLSSDCGTEGNGLPPQLRAGIISLSIWVSKHSSAVVRGEESIDDLININRTIMEGLADQARLQQRAQEENNDAQQQPQDQKPINSLL